MRHPASSTSPREKISISQDRDRTVACSTIRGRGADERRTVRQQKSRKLPAIRYTLSRWEGLTRFIDDGRIELDNNTVERSIRPIALNRKNALFAGFDRGAEHWATIASLIEPVSSTRRPTLLSDNVLTKIVNGHPNSNIDQLLPWGLPKARPSASSPVTSLQVRR